MMKREKDRLLKSQIELFLAVHEQGGGGTGGGGEVR
jgi:hypothetical protein